MMADIEIKPELLAELKAKAEAATQGPWRVDDTYETLVFLPTTAPNESIAGVCGDGERISAQGTLCKDRCIANAAFIAAANPQVVLALIAEIEELNVELEKTQRERDNLDDELQWTRL